MKRLFSISALATAAALAFAGSATAADMPMKAPPLPPPPAVYDWSGLYVGYHTGYLWGTVHDVQDGGFTADSDVQNWIAGFHVGLQKQFTGFGWGGLVLGVEGGLNEPLSHNDVDNFAHCANPAYLCGIRNFKDNWYAGGRLGLGFTLPSLPLWLGGDYLLTVSGGWTTAIFQRASFLPGTGFAGGGNSLERHDGAYVGAGLEHVLAKGNLVDWVSGIDWQHQFFDDQRDVDANGVGHTMNADVDIFRLRTTLKFK